VTEPHIARVAVGVKGNAPSIGRFNGPLLGQAFFASDVFTHSLTHCPTVWNATDKLKNEHRALRSDELLGARVE